MQTLPCELQLPQDDQVHVQSQSLPVRDTETLTHLVTSVYSIETTMKEHSRLLAESKKSIDTLMHEQMRPRATFAEVLKDQAQTRNTTGPGFGGEPHPATQSNTVTRSQHQYTEGGCNQSATPTTDYRHIVRAEQREMEERKKRVSSLVVRGLRVASASEAAAKFSDIVLNLTGEQVTWTEVCRIRSDTDLYRGNVHDNRVRKLILEEAKNLKDSEFSHVFIRRDLTFMQREELRARYPPRLQRQYQWSRHGGDNTTQQEKHSLPQLHSSLPKTDSPTQNQDTVPKQVVPSQTQTSPSPVRNGDMSTQNCNPLMVSSQEEGQGVSPSIPRPSPLPNEGN